MRHARTSVRAGVAGVATLAALFVVALSAPAALAQPTAGPSGQAFYTPPSPLPSGKPGTLVWYRPAAIDLGSDAPSFRAYDVLYVSEDDLGVKDAVTGVVIIPTSPWGGSGARPVVDYAWGTQGLSQSCAASEQLAAGSEYDSAAAVASLKRGWAVVATDYDGYTNGGTPSYVAGYAEGHDVLDVMRAAEQVPGAGISEGAPVTIWGYSQGGGAATWAGVLQPKYAPDVDLIGVAAGGVPANLAALTTFANDSVDSAFVMYSLIGFGKAYLIGSLLFNSAGKAFAQQLESGGCALSQIGPPVSDRDIDQYLQISLTQLTTNPLLSIVLKGNSLGGTPLKVPYFQYSGEYDEFVPLLQQIALKQQFCSEGVVDDYHLYPADHLLADPLAANDVAAWIANLLAGGAPPSTCGVDAPLPSAARTTPETGDLTIPITNWALGGQLTMGRLAALAFPAGSTLNATGDLTAGTFTGTASIPPIHQTISLLGVPLNATVTLQTNPLTGTVSLSPSGVLTLDGSTTTGITMQSTAIGSLQIPPGCHTSGPVQLTLDLTESATDLASGNLSASGTTTIPPWTGCGGIGPLLNRLGSGPGNPYTLTLTPPPAIPF